MKEFCNVGALLNGTAFLKTNSIGVLWYGVYDQLGTQPPYCLMHLSVQCLTFITFFHSDIDKSHPPKFKVQVEGLDSNDALSAKEGDEVVIIGKLVSKY